MTLSFGGTGMGGRARNESADRTEIDQRRKGNDKLALIADPSVNPTQRCVLFSKRSTGSCSLRNFFGANMRKHSFQAQPKLARTKAQYQYTSLPPWPHLRENAEDGDGKRCDCSVQKGQSGLRACSELFVLILSTSWLALRPGVRKGSCCWEPSF